MAARGLAKPPSASAKTFEQAAQDTTHPLHNFRVGIGIASGKAVAEKLGSADQVKVTAFGPVVNLAARLETMTKTDRRQHPHR